MFLLNLFQIGCIISFILFFGALFNHLTQEDRLAQDFWQHGPPRWLWHSLGGHLAASIIGSSLFLALREKGWLLRLAPLVIIATAVSMTREILRLKFMDHGLPQPLIEHLDYGSMILFLLCAIVMVVALIHAIRVAFSRQQAER